MRFYEFLIIYTTSLPTYGFSTDLKGCNAKLSAASILNYFHFSCNCRIILVGKNNVLTVVGQSDVLTGMF